MLHTILLKVAGLADFAILHSQHWMELFIMLLLLSLADDAPTLRLSAFNVAFTTLLQMLLDPLQWQIHLATLVDTLKRGVAQKALNSLACVLEVAIERLLATGTLFTAVFAGKARFADLLATARAIVRFNGQAGAIRASKVNEHLVIAGVEPHQMALNVV